MGAPLSLVRLVEAALLIPLLIGRFTTLTRLRLMGYLHNPTDVSETCVVRRLKVSCDKNGIDPT
jgi:hypothetical protein